MNGYLLSRITYLPSASELSCPLFWLIITPVNKDVMKIAYLLYSASCVAFDFI